MSKHIVFKGENLTVTIENTDCEIIITRIMRIYKDGPESLAPRSETETRHKTIEEAWSCIDKHAHVSPLIKESVTSIFEKEKDNGRKDHTAQWA